MTSREAIVIPNAQRSCAVQVRDPSVAPLEPEKRLMLAVLERAVDDFRTYAIVPTGRGRWLFMEVAAWFQSPATGPFDFEGICEATGLDPDFVRKGLRSWVHVHVPSVRGSVRTVARNAKISVLRPATETACREHRAFDLGRAGAASTRVAAAAEHAGSVGDRRQGRARRTRGLRPAMRP
jgi:hypothetical protein